MYVPACSLVNDPPFSFLPNLDIKMHERTLSLSLYLCQPGQDAKGGERKEEAKQCSDGEGGDLSCWDGAGEEGVT